MTSVACRCGATVKFKERRPRRCPECGFLLRELWRCAVCDNEMREPSRSGMCGFCEEEHLG